jgi:hypothetical protein
MGKSAEFLGKPRFFPAVLALAPEMHPAGARVFKPHANRRHAMAAAAN